MTDRNAATVTYDGQDIPVSDLFWAVIESFKDCTRYASTMGAKRMRVYNLDEIAHQAEIIASVYGIDPPKSPPKLYGE